jgi:hypothetical protein
MRKFIGCFLFSALVACVVGSSQGNEPPVYPTAQWSRSTAESQGMQQAKLDAARTYALTGGGAGLITRHGYVVTQWGDNKKKFDLKSTSKSIGVTALGLAIDDGKVKLGDLATRHHPNFGVPPEENSASGWLQKITLRQLANQSAGFEKPGGYRKLLFRPGSRWHYSDGGPNWLAECVTLAMQQDIESLMFEKKRSMNISAASLGRAFMQTSMPWLALACCICAKVNGKTSSCCRKILCGWSAGKIRRWSVCWNGMISTVMHLSTMACCGGTTPTEHWTMFPRMLFGHGVYTTV